MAQSINIAVRQQIILGFAQFVFGRSYAVEFSLRIVTAPADIRVSLDNSLIKATGQLSNIMTGSRQIRDSGNRI